LNTFIEDFFILSENFYDDNDEEKRKEEEKVETTKVEKEGMRRTHQSPHQLCDASVLRFQDFTYSIAFFQVHHSVFINQLLFRYF